MMEEWKAELPGNCGLFGRVNINALKSKRGVVKNVACHFMRPKMNIDPQARVSFDINCCDTVSTIKGLLQRRCSWLLHLPHINIFCLEEEG